MALEMQDLRVIADIGGTNVRFAVAKDGAYARAAYLSVRDYATFQDALTAYLGGLPDGVRPTSGAFAAAGPVSGDHVRLTNLGWSFSVAELQADFALSPVAVVNDFAGTAMAVPHLPAADRFRVGPAGPEASGPLGVIGPGTGLGVSALVPGAAGWTLLPGEGGHATMPAVTQEESRLLDHLRTRWDHLSAERVLSGAGLVNLYEAICATADRTALSLSPAEVTTHAMAGSDADCVQAFDVFCAMLGTVAGNLALTLGATGGIYIAGGIVPRFKEAFAASRFRERFEGKGRLADYMRTIPTYVILGESPALLGLANLALPAS